MLPSMRFCLAVLFITIIAVPALATDEAQVQKAWKILNAGVKEKGFTKRRDAIHAMGLLAGDSKAVAVAEKGLDDLVPEVREAAATTLGQLHSSSSIPKLQLALKDKEVPVVLAAAHSLWALGDKEGYEVYYEILLSERKAGPGIIAGEEAMVRDRKKLAEFGFEAGIAFNPFANLGWGIFKVIHQGDVSPVRAAAATVLADDPDPRSSQALVKSCSDKNWIVRVAALDALARRGDQAFLKDIEPHTSDEKDMVRYTAAAAIIRLNGATRQVKPAGEGYSN